MGLVVRKTVFGGGGGEGVSTKSVSNHRVLTRILKIGVKMLSTRKVWSFTILHYWDF